MMKRVSIAIVMGAWLSGASLLGVANAQMPTPGAPTIGPTMRPPSDQQAAPPPALPGAAGADQISASSVAIDNENPTKVLFSAINHGNYAEARAAVSRGADLRAKNALDETPIQLSVELGRNDITFMLLSVLHENRGVSTGVTLPINAASRVTTAHGRSIRRTAQRPVSMSAQRSDHENSLTMTAPAPSNPAGIAAPAKGFLGFGNGS
ncbi:hypothetical protein ACOSOMT5_P0623 [Acidiphilium sp. MT5]